MAGKSKYTFDSKIHVYRATRRMTQQELADRVGVSRQTIMQLERNRYNPSMLLAYSIARVFDVTIEELFDFSVRAAGMNGAGRLSEKQASWR